MHFHVSDFEMQKESLLTLDRPHYFQLEYLQIEVRFLQFSLAALASEVEHVVHPRLADKRQNFICRSNSKLPFVFIPLGWRPREGKINELAYLA